MQKRKQQKAKIEEGPIANDILVPVLNYLFPDAEGDFPTSPYPETLNQVPFWSSTDLSQDHPLKVS